MPVEADLVAYLDPLVSETAGTDLFEGPIPELPNACVVLQHTGGQDGEYVMGPSLTTPDLERVRVQLMVRNPAKATAVSRANAVHALLDNLGPVTLSTRLYHRVHSIDGPPHSLGQDVNLRWRLVANYEIEKARG